MQRNIPTAEEVVINVMKHFGFRRNYQVAEYFDVTPQTLSGWIKSGEIPPKHLIKYTTEVLGSDETQKETLQTNYNDNQNYIIDNETLFNGQTEKQVFIQPHQKGTLPCALVED